MPEINARSTYIAIIAITFSLLTACGGGGRYGGSSPLVVDEETVPPSGSETAPPGGEWRMIWSDEFDGDSVNEENWSFQTGDGTAEGIPGWGNNEKQFYQTENISVADGFLSITAREERAGGYPFTSGRMRSYEKVDVTYGRIEASIKAPEGIGFWGAFWLLSTNSPYGEWAASGEIDVVELVNQGTRDNVFGTAHFGMQFPLNQFTGREIKVAAHEDFHVYAIEWEKDEIRWYLDDVHYSTLTSDHWWSYYWGGPFEGYQSAPKGGPFDQPFHLILNLAVGGNLPGPVAQNTAFPAAMEVDYVRIYECDAGNEDGSGCASNVSPEVVPPPARSVATSTQVLYGDSVGPLTWEIAGQTVTRALSYSARNGLSVVEVAADNDARGTVLELTTNRRGNLAIFPTDGEPLILENMGNNPNFFELHGGELRFDMYIDGAATDQDSEIQVKMESGFPGSGIAKIPVADLPQDQWFTYSVQINELLANRGFAPLDTTKIENVFVFEPTSFSRIQLDDIHLICGHPTSCGVQSPSVEIDRQTLDVFIDDVDPTWSKGIGAWDDETGFDYFDGNSGLHVTWEITDTGEEGRESVLRANFSESPANGVIFIQSNTPIDLSGFAQGRLIFDLKVAEGTSAGITYKIDCLFPCTSGDQQLLGVKPGEWLTFSIRVADLVSQGLDITRVNTGIVIFPDLGEQSGVTFWLDNVRWEI